MRAAPALQVTVEHFGWWRAALAVLMILAIAVPALWWALTEDASRLHAAALILCVLAVAAAASLLRPRAFRLRWDGECWHVGAAASAQPEPWSGRVGVALDFGGWMLLRFAPASGPRRCPYRWLPVQQSGLGPQWPGLRGAVYSARSEPPRNPTARSPARPDSAE